MCRGFLFGLGKYEGAKSLVTTALTCGYCGEHVAPSKGYCISLGDRDVAYIYACPHCQNPIIYFTADKDSSKDHLVFNRTVTLKDTFQLPQK